MTQNNMTHHEILDKQIEDLRQAILSESFAVSSLVRHSERTDKLRSLSKAFDEYVEATYELNKVFEKIENARESVRLYKEECK